MINQEGQLPEQVRWVPQSTSQVALIVSSSKRFLNFQQIQGLVNNDGNFDIHINRYVKSMTSLQNPGQNFNQTYSAAATAADLPKSTRIKLGKRKQKRDAHRIFTTQSI